MEVSCAVTNILQNIVFCVPQKLITQVWNDDKIVIFWLDHPFKVSILPHVLLRCLIFETTDKIVLKSYTNTSRWEASS